MENIKYSTEAFERYLDASVALFMECYAETISTDFDAEHQKQASQELNEKCKALIKATHRRQKLMDFIKGCGKVMKAAAVASVVLLALSSFLFITVEAVREPILNFYIKENDGHWELSNVPFETNPDNPIYTAPDAEFNVDDPLQYLLPENFTLISITGDMEIHLAAHYQNPQLQSVIFECSKSDSSVRINTENAEVSQLKISGYDAILSEHESTGNLTLIWYNSDLNRTLSLDTDALAKDDLISIAETLNYLLMK